MNSKRLLMVILLLPLCSIPALCDQLSDQRQRFLQAEKYLTEKKEANFLEVSAGLADYPLYPYLRFQWLKDRLDKSDQVLAFLTEFKDTRFAALLRSKWLDYLAGQERWREFVRHYEADADSAGDCRWQWAKYQTGQRQPVLIEAKRLWLTGQNNGKDCRSLFLTFETSAEITSEMIWQRFEAAIASNQTETAKTAARLFTPSIRKQAETWLKLYQKTELVSGHLFQADKNARAGRLFAHTIKRLANTDIDKAMAVWDSEYGNFALEPAVVQPVEYKFGAILLGKKDKRAYDRLNKIVQPDEETRTTKVRAALLQQDWRHVSSALADLTVTERNDPKWQYWQARALQETGKQQQAVALYTALAKDRSYYGFLAADAINAPYQIADSPVAATQQALQDLAGRSAFKACWEFKALGLELEAKRQWQYAIKNLSRDQLLLAAKLAQQWQWVQLAITTLVKADYWDDLALRFPVDYLSEVKTSSRKHSLETAVIYGLMRQESMLDKTAASTAGALGLMQLMPETAKVIAQKLLQPWQTSAVLFNPGINIDYGSFYFKDLLTRYGGNYALASAAYNAGPNRVKKWLPIENKVPADIWIETIPFKETRKYVSTVLSYAMIYQQRLKIGGLKLSRLLPVVTPGEKLS